MPTFLRFDYTNHRGEFTPNRLMRLTGVRFGESEWFDGPQALVEGIDYPRGVERTFAVRNMTGIVVEDRFDEVPPKDRGPLGPVERVIDDLRGKLKSADLVATISSGNKGIRLLAEAYNTALTLAVALRQELEREGMSAEALLMAEKLDRPWGQVIETARIGPRFVNAMTKLGVVTMRQLVELTNSDIRRTEGLGDASVRKMFDEIARVGLTPRFTRPKEKEKEVGEAISAVAPVPPGAAPAASELTNLDQA